MAISHVTSLGNGSTSSASFTIPGVPGGALRCYVVTGGAKNGVNRITTITGGGLSFSQIVIGGQCSGRNQVSVDCWIACGSPVGPFTLTITFDGIDKSVNALVDVFDGVDNTTPTANGTGENTNGVLGACAGGVDSSPALSSVTVNNIAASVTFVAAQYRNETITTPTGWTLRGTQSNGTSGDESEISTFTKDENDPNPQAFSGTLSNPEDWATIGFELVSFAVTTRTFASGCISITSGAAAGVKGTYVDLFSTPDIDTQWIVVMINVAITAEVEFDLANQSNVILTGDIFTRVNFTAGDEGYPFVYSAPLFSAASNGVRMRIADSFPGPVVYQVAAVGSNQPFQRAISTAFESSGIHIPGGTPAGPVSGAIAGLYGPWIELIASTGFESKWGSFQCFRPFTAGGSEVQCAEFQIGYGAIGDENAQIDRLGLNNISISGGKMNNTVYNMPMVFPAGARIVTRVKSSTAGAKDFGAGITLTD